MMQTVASGARALPDVNAETYPYDVVQYLLDQAANFVLLAVPDPGHAGKATLTPRDPKDYFGINGGYGIDVASVVHRFDAVVGTPQGDRLETTQATGDDAGTLRGRFLFGPNDAPWAPGEEPPPTLFDPWRSQRFTMVDAEIHFRSGDAMRLYGMGRTFPMVVNGKPVLYAGAVGNLVEGTGEMRGLHGTYVMTGSLVDLGFLGNITCRVVDPQGRLRTDRDLPAMTTMPDPDPGSTYLVLRGVKKDRTVKTTYGPPPDARRVSLITPSQMRSARFGFADSGREGLRTRMEVGPVVGTMDATVYFDLLAPPGTDALPVPFTTDEVYVFRDSDGRTVGTVNAGVVDGISFGLQFPAAPGQPGVRFAGFGPITGGTGIFAGAQGMLTVNSLIGIAPHTLSLLHVLQLADPGGRYRQRAKREQEPRFDVLAENDPYLPLLREKEAHTEVYRRWRRTFQTCSRQFADLVSHEFNKRLDIGEFPGLRIDPDALAGAFATGVQPFSLETFNRYAGPAKGTFRIYEVESGRETSTFTLYSYWNETNLHLHDGRTAKKINGSDRGYFRPDPSPDLAEKKVDIIFNSWRPDVGLTSWVEIYQHWRQQRTSFAYKLPHPHEILWFVKDISRDGKAIEDNVLMASHEWKGVKDGTTCYYLVGIFLDFDFERCTAVVTGDTFWRALYVEEPKDGGH